MKTFNLILFVLFSFSLFANGEERVINISTVFESGPNLINDELIQLNQINKLLIDSEMNYATLEHTHPSLIAEVNLSSSVSDDMFENHPDSPLGIPGFFWGFCLGVIGVLIVFISMEPGEGRKEQTRNACFGILTNVGISLLVYLGLLWAFL